MVPRGEECLYVTVLEATMSGPVRIRRRNISASGDGGEMDTGSAADEE